MLDDQKPANMAEYRKTRIVGAGRVILALLMNERPTTDDFLLTVTNLSAGLSETERELLLHAIITSLPADTAETLVRGAFEGAGYPRPALMEDSLSDARFWAGDANSKELGAYAMACFERMTPQRRADFIKWAEAQK